MPVSYDIVVIGAGAAGLVVASAAAQLKAKVLLVEGSEIENPFGRDPNDLPLDNICNKMKHNIADLINST